MSERNGDKARFQRERKRKILNRTRSRALRKALEQNKGNTRRLPVEGLTEKDLIEGISATYGTATTPAATITSSPFVAGLSW